MGWGRGEQREHREPKMAAFYRNQELGEEKQSPAPGRELGKVLGEGTG